MHAFHVTQKQKSALISYLRENAEFSLEALDEEMSIEGNCSAIDPATDAAQEEWIRGELANGNEWAWCCVRVTASFAGHQGTDYLGGCSYRSADDFKTPGGYFDDMKERATEELAAAIVRDAEKIEELAAIFRD